MDTKIKLSIIVVSWNVRALLEKCLASVFLYAPQFSFEVIVIDNASHDASVDMITQKFPQVNCIANADNKGFASATNQGIRIAQGEYILFLNPDTEVTHGSLEKLVSSIEGYSKIGIVAPKLLNPDGTLQASIRRFPAPLSQFLMFLKLHHLRRAPSPIQKYLNKDFDYTKKQEIDQPQGAAFLIRRAVIDAVGLFDEKFFIWFEEVDFCKRTHDVGYTILYAPEAEIIHHGGQSFRQRFSLDKQILFYTSCAYYLWKHFSWKSLYAVLPMKAYCTMLSLIKKMRVESHFLVCHSRENGNPGKLFFITCAFIAVSLIGFIYPSFAPVGFLIIVTGVAILSFLKLEYGVMAVIAELIVGSKGYLLSISLGEVSVSIRYVLFVILCVAWFFHRKSLQQTRVLPKYLFIPCVVLSVIVSVGVIQGYASGYDHASLFHDSNAWLFFLVFVPFFAGLADEGAVKRLFTIASAALTAHIVKVLALFYIMGHHGFGIGFIEMMYRWTRATGIAEITPFGFNIFRVFFQSQIYALIAFCVLLAYAGVFFMRHSEDSMKNTLQDFFKNHIKEILLFIGSVAVILVSFSRSFWFAAGCVGFCWLVVMFFQKYRLKSIALVCAAVFIGSMMSGVFLFAFSRFPIPLTKGGFNFDLIAQRTGNISDEAAAASRWSSLPVLLNAIQQKPFFGYGFGKELTYISKDPRILEANPSGVYTTYAFEWGYLDMMVKFGIVGLVCYLFLLLRILLWGWRAIRFSPLVFGVWLGLIAVMITHIFSPYLNHPLGIGYVILAGVLFERLKK
ncbi:glycosyltransferase [Candidatus Uhrbacteria bacterium]|nr:glycosyltransferase [Candidatus Uhrbacteria bacterium]